MKSMFYLNIYTIQLYYSLRFEKGYHNRDSLVHPTRAIQFLVGVRGKNEALAIGGPWSPSLDGLDPASDPSVRHEIQLI